MKKDAQSLSKNKYRIFLKDLRASLSRERKRLASESALASLKQKLSYPKFILSFASMPDEIDLWHFNRELANENKLVLLKVYGNQIRLYLVKDLTRLKLSKFKILEPEDEIDFDPNKIETALIPGIGFDKHHHRLGFGKGHYDRFLSNFPNLWTIGIGFKEQYVECLPTEAHDIQLKEVLLF
ncbi:MAG: 5-formyltetrahydrofolate cyclo-ligase [Chlamydiae bacterium]|nr:5-formyltetrahydrofolate cyclo-ligase [Chlamydiota bacterium]